MGKVLEFNPRETVHILKFTAPRPLKMRKTGKERISVELHKVDESHGLGQAWVKIQDGNEETVIRKVDNKDILLVSDEDPGNDDTLADAIDIYQR